MFSFNSQSSTKLGIVVSDSNHLTKGRRRVEIIAVPGREDDLIIEDKTRENITVSIRCVVDAVGTGKKIGVLIDEIDTWLNVAGYKDLVFDDGTKLKACFTGEIAPTKIRANAYEIELEFSAYKEVLSP